MFHLGFGLVCWQSKKKNTISLPSTKAEYRGAVTRVTKAIWLQYSEGV